MDGANRAAELYERGIRLAREGEFDQALHIADELSAMRFSGGFEVAALAHAGRADHAKAVQVLEEGVQLAPDVWALWQLLGNERSLLRRFGEAHDAYQRALGCPGVHADSVRLNQGILELRRGRNEECLRFLESVGGPEFAAWRGAYRAAALRALGRLDEAERAARSVIDAPRPEGRAVQDVMPVELAVVEFLEVRRARGDVPSILRELAIALRPRASRTHLVLAWIRDLDAARSPNARYLRIMVEGRVRPGFVEGGRPHGLLSAFDVVAEDAAEALEFVRPFLHPGDVESLTVTECTDIEARPTEPKGVYRGGGATFFPLED